MQITINKLMPQLEQEGDQMKVFVRFFDEINHFHQSCEVVVFVPKNIDEPLGKIHERAILGAKDFFRQCLK